MASAISAKSFFCRFVYDPFSPILSKNDRRIALIASAILAIGTLFTVHLVCYFLFKDKKIETIKEYSASLVRKTLAIWQGYAPSPEARTASMEFPSNPILGGLHLGNGIGFLSCTGLDVPVIDRSGRNNGSLATDNPAKFAQIVTVCPLHSIREHCEEVMDSERLSQRLRDRNIQWHYVGRAAADVKNRAKVGDKYDPQEANLVWRSLVHDCTLDSPLSQTESFGITAEAMRALCAQKSQVLQDQSQEMQWFERTFQVLDRALFDGSKTLVHCAQGMSRSASVVAAYLINRLGLSADEAVRYLQVQRPCVDPGFIEPLQAYFQTLQATQ